jgi:hypothetical protein
VILWLNYRPDLHGCEAVVRASVDMLRADNL